MSAVAWALWASTYNRARRGEGALLAVNASLAVTLPGSAIGGLLASVVTLALMYAFNDLYDARMDVNNPKKDKRLIQIYLEHERVAFGILLALKLLTIAVSWRGLSGMQTVAVAVVLVVNVIYSVFLKSTPVIDVIWCGVWGMAYAAIVSVEPTLLSVVGLMTAICHLFQTLDDRVADAANAIITTAVRSPALSRNVLIGLTGVLTAVLVGPFGILLAASAFAPLVIYFLEPEARIGWLITKAYFAVMWLGLLSVARASG